MDLYITLFRKIKIIAKCPNPFAPVMQRIVEGVHGFYKDRKDC